LHKIVFYKHYGILSEQYNTYFTYKRKGIDMKKHFIIFVLALGIVSNPIICNDVTSKTKTEHKKKKRISSTITALGIIASVLVEQASRKYTSHRTQIIRGSSCLALATLATAIGYDIWQLNRNIISSSFDHSVKALVYRFVVNLALNVAVF
jgi:uncharacterized membrane protein YbjE (DUF340 family)